MSVLINIIFAVLAILILVSAILVVTVQNVIHASLWLIATFFGVGALYLLMEAEFVAVVQVLVYVGAISILILFAIMLTRNIDEGEQQLYRNWWAAMIVAAALFGLLIVPTVLTHRWGVDTEIPGASEQISTARELGRSFMSEYLLPFEVASVLLLVALIGAIVIAFEKRNRRRRILTLAEEVALRRARQNAAAETDPDQPGEGDGPETGLARS